MGSGNYQYWHASSPSYCAPTSYGAEPPDCEAYDSIHMGGANIVFCDGHAAWKPYRSLRSGMFGLTPDEAYQPTPTQSAKVYRAAF